MKKILLLFIALSTSLISGIYLEKINSENYPDIEAEIFISEGGTPIAQFSEDDIAIFEGADRIEGFQINLGSQALIPNKKVLLVIESTASISPSENELIKDIVLSFTDNLQNSAELAITSFNNYSFILSEFTDSRNQVESVLDFLLPNGIGDLNTALLSDAVNAIEIAAENNAEIVFINDGDLTGNAITIVNEALDNNVKIHSLILGSESNPPLTKISNDTGGDIYTEVDESNFQTIIGTILNKLYYDNPAKITWESSFCNSPATINMIHIPSASNFEDEYNFPEDAINITFLPSPLIRIENVETSTTYYRDITIRSFNSDFEIQSIEYTCDGVIEVNYPTGLLEKDLNHDIQIDYFAEDDKYRVCEFVVNITDCSSLKFYIELGKKEEGIAESQLKVETPNGGEVFFPNEKIAVSWANSNPFDNYRIDISSNSGLDWKFEKDVEKDVKDSITLPSEIGSDYRVRVSQYTDGERLSGVRYFDTEGAGPLEFEFNRNSNLLAVYTIGSEVDIWNVTTGDKLGTAGSSIFEGSNLVWSNITDQVAIFNKFVNNEIVILNADLQTPPIKLDGPDNSNMTSMDWNSDDTEIVLSDDEGNVYFYEIGNSSPTLTLPNVHDVAIREIQYHPEQNWIFWTDRFGDVYARNLNTDRNYLIQTTGVDDIKIEFSTTGDTLFTFNERNGIFLTRIREAQNGRIDGELIFSNNKLTNDFVDWSPDSKRVIINEDNLINVISPDSFDTLYTYIGHSEPITMLKERNNWVASFDGNRIIQVWNYFDEHSPTIFQRDQSDNDFRIVPIVINTNDIHLGDICRGFTKDTIIDFAYTNNSPKDITIDRIFISNDPNGNFSAPLEGVKSLAPARSASLRVQASPRVSGSISAKYYLESLGQLFEGNITANVIEPKFNASRDILDLGSVLLNEETDITFDIVENISNSTGIIDSAKIFFPDRVFDLPDGIVSPGEIIEYTGTFDFDVLGPKTGLTRVFTQDNCTPIQVQVTVDVVAPNPTFSGQGIINSINCEEAQTDIITFVNTGEGDLLIKEITDNNPNFEVISYDDVVEAGRIGRIEIEYSRDEVGLDSAEISIISNTTELYSDITRVKLFFEKNDTRYITNQTDFLFAIPESEQELLVQNIGDRNINIEIPEAEYFDFVVNQTELRPNEETTIIITALPINLPIQDRFSSATINILGFCDTKSIEINSDFRDLLPVYSTLEEVDFGTVFCSETSIDTTLIIRNIGNAELEVTNLRVIGNQSANFELIDNEDFILLPEEEREITIRFNPDREFDNQIVLTAETNSTQNNGLIEIPISIDFIYSELDIDLSNIIIDNLDFDTEAYFTIPVLNLGNTDILLSPNLSDNQNFVIDSISNNPPPAGESAVINLRFLGGDIDELFNLILSVNDLCENNYDKSYEINVIGTRFFEIAVGDFEGVPGEILNIPIQITNNSNSKLPDNGDYSATITYNETLLTPTSGISNISNSLKSVPFTGNLLDEIDGNSQEIPFRVNLGNSESTILNIRAEFTDDSGYGFRSNAGSFRYTDDYLRENPGFVDGNIRINFQGPNPNPVRSRFYISFNMIEVGRCSLFIVDIAGKKIKTLIDEERNTGYYEEEFNSLEIASGFYYLVFETPTYRKLTGFTVTN